MVDDTSPPLARRIPPPRPGFHRGFLGRRGSRWLYPTFFMHRTALRRAAEVSVLPQNEFSASAFVVASEFVGCGGARPTPEVHFQVLPRTSSSGKGRQSVSVSKLTAVALSETWPNKSDKYFRLCTELKISKGAYHREWAPFERNLHERALWGKSKNPAPSECVN